MNTESLLNEKLLIKLLPTNFFTRPSLIETFNEALNKRITLVQAPGGCGKTTSTIYWLSKSHYQPIWISLDEYDNLPNLFYRIFCDALASKQPENQRLQTIVNSPDFSSSPIEYTLLAIRAFDSTAQNYVLILDDFQAISNPKILKSIPYVLNRLPLAIKIIFLSREELPIELTSHYGEPKISKIVAENLIFSNKEIFNYFKNSNILLKNNELEHIQQQTNGWPLAISFLTQKNQSYNQNIATLNINHFIEENIWTRWTYEQQQFLLLLALPDEITPELVQFITEDGANFQKFTELTKDHFMIQEIAPEKYQFHDVFLEFLLQKNQKQPQKEIKKIYQKLAFYYLEHNDIFKARVAAIKSENQRLMTIMLLDTAHYYSKKMSTEEYLDTVLSFQVTNIPEETYQLEPTLNIIPVWYYFLIGDREKMIRHLDDIHLNFDKILTNASDNTAEVLLACGLDVRLSLLEKIEQLNAIIPEFSLIPANNDSQNVSIVLQLPFIHRSILDFYELAHTDFVDNNLIPFDSFLKQEMHVVKLSIAAGLAYEKNQLTKAFELSYASYALLTEKQDDEFLFAAKMQLIHLHYLSGNQSEFLDLKNKLTDWIEESQNYYLAPNFYAYETRIALWNGDENAAISWLDNYYAQESRTIEVARIQQHLTTLRAYILLNKKHEAIVLGEQLQRYTIDFRRLLDQAEVTTLLTIAYWSLGNKKQAVQLLDSMIQATQPYNFIRVFADEGAALLPILTRLKNQKKAAKNQNAFDSTYLTEIIFATTQVAQKQKGILPLISTNEIKLSKQQLHMIQLLSQGYTFAEMAEKTTLSIHTVRAHVSLAYQKLQVNNATDAVLVAKKNKLI